MSDLKKEARAACMRAPAVLVLRIHTSSQLGYTYACVCMHAMCTYVLQRTTVELELYILNGYIFVSCVCRRVAFNELATGIVSVCTYVCRGLICASSTNIFNQRMRLLLLWFSYSG